MKKLLLIALVCASASSALFAGRSCGPCEDCGEYHAKEKPVKKSKKMKKVAEEY